MTLDHPGSSDGPTTQGRPGRPDTPVTPDPAISSGTLAGPSERRGTNGPPTPAVALHAVDKRFGSAPHETVALSDVTLEVPSGGFVSLIGPSGCGKSTLLRIIADLLPPTAGTVAVAGVSAHEAREHRRYGMVFQSPTLFGWRSVRRNVELPLELAGHGRADRRRRAAEMLDLVELSDFAGHRPAQLSGGMQQRVAIARALAFQPEILLMDEPFGALDEITRERMNDELLRIWRATGTTIVFVTHSISEAVFLSSQVVVMSARPGRIERVLDVDLPYPRTEDTREAVRYFQLVTEVRETLRGGARRGSADEARVPGADGARGHTGGADHARGHTGGADGAQIHGGRA